MSSLAYYIGEAARLNESRFRAEHPSPMLVARQILGGEIKRHKRELTWIEREKMLETITLLLITDSSQNKASVDSEVMRNRPVVTNLCVPICPTTATSYIW